MNSTFRSLARPLLTLTLVGFLAACTGAGVDVGSLIRQAADPSAQTSAVADSTAEAAVKQVIESSNQAQATAFNRGDPSAMRAYATDSFYQQLLQTNRDLSTSGVTKIEVVSTEYRSVTVDGTNAKATTYETWRSTYNDGTTDEATARNDYTLVLVSGSWKVDADDQPSGVAEPAPQTQPSTGVTGPAASSFSSSSNWSGYEATGGTFTSVSGTWTVPSVSATTTGADATWVGVGGIDTRDLIQAGTQATVQGGEIQYEAWIEMLPASSRQISLTVSPGDSVTVAITQQAGNNWTIDMKNNTTGAHYGTTGTLPLDDFGTLSFTRASAVRDGKTMDLKALGAQAITMINGARQPLATPSVVGSDGGSFSITRTQNPNTSAGGQRRRRG